MLTIAAAVVLSVAPCPHPFFPMEEGLQLRYRAGRQQVSFRVLKVEERDGGLEATVQLDTGRKVSETIARCSAAGVSAEAGGLEGMALKATGMEMAIRKAEGLAFPPSDDMAAGKKWQNRIDLELRPPASVKLPGGFKPVIQTTIEKESEVVGKDRVQVEAGTFDALKVANRTTARAGETAADARTIESTVWMAPGVGIIKLATGDSVDLELVGIERPPKKRR